MTDKNKGQGNGSTDEKKLRGLHGNCTAALDCDYTNLIARYTNTQTVNERPEATQKRLQLDRFCSVRSRSFGLYMQVAGWDEIY